MNYCLKCDHVIVYEGLNPRLIQESPFCYKHNEVKEDAIYGKLITNKSCKSVRENNENCELFLYKQCKKGVTHSGYVLKIIYWLMLSALAVAFVVEVWK